MNTPPLVTIQAQRDHLAHCKARLDRLRAESIYYPASTLHTAKQTVRREVKYLRELERKQAKQEVTA